MAHQKFDLTKLEKLNDPARAESLPPHAMWEALDAPEASTLVEIGAGTGFFARHLVQMASGSVVHAVDVAPAMVEWMREHLSEVSEGTIVPLLADETHVPLPDGMADVVYMVNLHHELADPGASYAEAARLLRSGGRMLVVDWADHETPRGPRLEIRASIDDLQDFLECAGLSDIRAHQNLPWHHMVTATKTEDV